MNTLGSRHRQQTMTTLLDDAMELLQVAMNLEEHESTRIEAATKYYESCKTVKIQVRYRYNRCKESCSRHLTL